ncbi:MAG: HRDC domain-containing protein [Alistipes ihumii]|uniref:HRDC domain-containing protein n=1 Tax=Alistipes ihumii TaxID=1470347 RepID=UPI00265DF749|nr:HRDC domain-containing protein [Alistipes ihumii]
MENPELELARRFVERTATSVFLTGKAGTGKTTFLRELRARSPKRMIVLAPTGVAAINAGGVTIHSFFQLAFAPYVPESERGIAPDRPREAVRFSRQKIAIIKSIDLLVIDEISMVRADVLDAVSDVLRRFRDRRKPFGGVQLLLIGDVQQLAPVVRDEEWALLRTFYDSPFFFDSKALKQTDYVGIELQRVYRQSDGRFVELLNRVRDGRVDRNVLDELNRRYVPGFRPGDDEGYITLTSHNHTADAINERRLAELDAPSHTFEAEIEGAFPEYLYPTHPSLTLKKGAQVMFVKNDPSPEKRYYNGRIGTVTALDENRVEVLPRGESVPIAVEPAEWTNAKYVIDPDSKEISERIEGRFVQYPLRTAWAITIHKSQGLTFDRAVIDAAASFSHGQVYVALSRCRSLDGLVLSSPLDERCIVGDPTVQGFCERVSSERPDGTELERRSRAYYRDLLLELFDFDSLGASLRRLGDFVAEHFGKLYPKLALQWQQGTAEFGASVTDVARRFRLQLESLLRSDERERLRERVVKGAAYFAEQCGRVVAPLIEASYVETDSKETRKALAGLLDLSGERLRVKTATLEAASGGFDVFRHLEARARVAAEGAATRTKKETKATAGEDVLHPELFERLRLWRREQAAEAGVPAYVVMSQQALLGIANLLPGSSAELGRIKGVGPKLVERYGEQVLSIVALYRAERGDDLDFEARRQASEASDRESPRTESGAEKERRTGGRTSKTREDTRLATLRLLEEGLDVPAIARERGLRPMTVTRHIADLIGQGVLRVERFLPSDKIETIARYLGDHPGETLTRVCEALGGDVSFRDVLYVRSSLSCDSDTADG